MTNQSPSLIVKFAERFSVDPKKLMDTLKATAFKQSDGSAPTNEQMMALMVVADQYGLNPFTREIYAYPDKQNGIIPVVGVDGWSRIINSHEHFDGVEFVYSDEMITMPGAKVECPAWIETVMYRKDRTRPIKIREFLDEVYRGPFVKKGSNGSYTVDGPWQTHTKRQLRHKSFIQCSRVAFGFVGIFDHDEAERIRDMGEAVVVPNTSLTLDHQVNRSAGETLLIEHKELHPILDRLVERAEASGAWSAAHQYVEERYTGSERQYATQYLRDAEIENMEPPATSYEVADGETEYAEEAVA